MQTSRRALKSRTILRLAVGLCSCLASRCTDVQPPRSVRELELLLTAPTALELSQPDSRPVLMAERDRLFLVVQRPHSNQVLQSTDRGKSWTPLFTLAGDARTLYYDRSLGGFHAVWVDQGVPMHANVIRGTVTDESSIGKARPGKIENIVLNSNADGVVAVAWIDSSSGWPELFFSRSQDHGRTWSVPVRVGDFERPSGLFAPILHYQADSWWLIWPENRGQATLFDLYLSRSPDGRSWSRSLKVNDDSAQGWNWFPSCTGSENRLFVVFSDYRDRDSFRQPDENVYFSQVLMSDDRPGTNVRLNDGTRGYQTAARIAYDRVAGRLLSVWRDQRDHLSSDIYACFSDDEGRSWSVNQKLNANERPEFVRFPQLLPAPDGGFYIGWTQGSGGRMVFSVRKAEGVRVRKAPAARRTTETPLNEATRPSAECFPVQISDFESSDLQGWLPLSGNWVNNAGVLLGYGKSVSYVEWPGGELGDFVIEGKFRLNPLVHQDASILFRYRTQAGSPTSGLMLRNQFREGVWLVKSDSGFERWEVATQPLADAWFPFRQDTWYSFRLSVEGSHLDYEVNSHGMLSFDGLETPRKGKLGLSTGGSPVEFDDIKIYRLDKGR
ncbi:MAG: DUF1080 domain-containing protein [Acidobacteria bacterium]|nr:MAG: DUF1080 domain-containing protein [Acidobacteriota bacterium]